MLVTKTFKFDAAHNLIKYHGKCERLHGHTYRLDVTIEGKLDDEKMIIDFLVLKNIVKEQVLDLLDHSYLNDYIKQPTAESIAIWIWKRLESYLSNNQYHLYEIRVFETETSFVTYRGD
ncbi:MAG: 6-carboxytetrahydropterin synthase QueD [Thermotogota bacterium]|nr:6-carboxytetrahydropterin synthase QueD [Thermotogota bacterium]